MISIPISETHNSSCSEDFKQHHSARISWNKEYDIELETLAEQNNFHNWNIVSNLMNSKFKNIHFSSKQCRERYTYCLNPVNKKTALTQHEHLALIAYHHIFRNKWAMIARNIPNRSGLALKNNFKSLLRKVAISIAEMDFKNFKNFPLCFMESLHGCLIIMDYIEQNESIPFFIEMAIPLQTRKYIKFQNLTKQKCEKFMEKALNHLLSQHSCESLSLYFKERDDFKGKMKVIHDAFIRFYRGTPFIEAYKVGDLVMSLLDQASNLLLTQKNESQPDPPLFEQKRKGNGFYFGQEERNELEPEEERQIYEIQPKMKKESDFSLDFINYNIRDLEGKIDTEYGKLEIQELSSPHHLLLDNETELYQMFY